MSTDEPRRRLSRTARRLTVYLGESDTWHHKPLYSELVHRAHAAGLAGASVLRGIEGFGSSSRIHTSRLLSLSEDLPVVVVVVDEPERIDAFLPQVEELVTEGLVLRAQRDGDRRTSIVRLTRAGEEQFRTMAAAHEGWIDALLGGVSGNDARRLATMLKTFRSNWEKQE